MTAKNDGSVKTYKPSADKHETSAANDSVVPSRQPVGATRAKEIGGRKGPEPTRFGDWEKNGRCIDF